MAHDKKEIQWRNAGLAYALRLVEEGGVELLRERVKFYNAVHVPYTVTKTTITDAIEDIKNNTIDTILVLSIDTMIDIWNLPNYQLEQFYGAFMEKTDLLIAEYSTWDEIIEKIKNERGLEYSIRRNE